MKFDKMLLLKWLSPNDSRLEGADFTIVNHCMLSAHDEDRNVVGLTVFDPRDLNIATFKKLEKRMISAEFAGITFKLTAPEFLKHRTETLLSGPEWKMLSRQYSSFIKIQQRANSFFVRDVIRVVNVDDSPVLLKFLRHSINEFESAEVIAQVNDPLKAVETICKMRPDVVTLDLQMPIRNGVQVLQELLAKEYFPVIIISSLNMEEGSMAFEALNSGAAEYLQKPRLEDRQIFKEELKNKILCAIESNKPRAPLAVRSVVKPSGEMSDNTLWCLGASTGGTQALTRVFTSLPHKIPPTLVVQHIPPVFSRAFAQSLNELCAFDVSEAVHGEPLLQNHVYIAPGGLQMGVEQRGSKLFISLSDSAPVNRFKPSVDYLFEEVAKLSGYNVVAGILTGMGKDGADGLLTLLKSGAHTLAQDEQSCAVFGMPRAAIEAGAVTSIVSLDEIAEALMRQSLNFKKTG